MKQTNFLKLLFMLAVLHFPILASADNSGTCGENLTWTYNESTKTLTISGKGDMADYKAWNAPWFDYISEIQTVIIEDGVTSIGEFAFYSFYYEYSNLTSVDIPNSVMNIGLYAFRGCSSLTSSLNISGNIGEEAFMGCTGLKSVSISGNVGDGAFRHCTGLENISINEGVENIGPSAFLGCPMTTIHLPSTVTTIDAQAFAYCSCLSTITVASGNKTFDSRDNCNAIIKTAENELIQGCKNTVIPNTVTSLGQASYMGVEIEDFIVPENITTIGRTVFYECPNLKTLIFGNSVTSIAGKAINKCPLLETIKIGSGLKSIDDENILRCEGLKDLYLFANTIPQRTNQNYDKIYLFDKTPISTATLHVPASLVDSYKATAPWSGFGNVVPLTEDDNLSGVSVVNSDTSFNTATPVYNLSGQRLMVPQKGINIVNGKKVVVK